MGDKPIEMCSSQDEGTNLPWPTKDEAAFATASWCKKRDSIFYARLVSFGDRSTFVYMSFPTVLVADLSATTPPLLLRCRLH